MRALAKDVGLTPMALYRHFPDKDAIVHALTMEALKDWSERLEALAEAPPFEWLITEADAFLDFALETPRRFEAAFLLPSPSIRQLPGIIHDELSPPINTIVGVIKRGQREGVFCDVPAADIFMTCWGLTQGLISLYQARRFSGGEAEFRAIYRAAIRRCLQSFTREDTPA